MIARSSNPSAAWTATTTGRPAVSVPVLSNSSTVPSRQSLERATALDDDPEAGGPRQAGDDRHRGGQDQRARRRHHEHGDGSHRIPGQQPRSPRPRRPRPRGRPRCSGPPTGRTELSRRPPAPPAGLSRHRSSRPPPWWPAARKDLPRSRHHCGSRRRRPARPASTRPSVRPRRGPPRRARPVRRPRPPPPASPGADHPVRPRRPAHPPARPRPGGGRREASDPRARSRSRCARAAARASSARPLANITVMIAPASSSPTARAPINAASAITSAATRRLRAAATEYQTAGITPSTVVAAHAPRDSVPAPTPLATPPTVSPTSEVTSSHASIRRAAIAWRSCPIGALRRCRPSSCATEPSTSRANGPLSAQTMAAPADRAAGIAAWRSLDRCDRARGPVGAAP